MQTSALTGHTARDVGRFILRTLKGFKANQGLLLAGAVAYYALDWRGPAALVVGSEAHGLSAAARAAAPTRAAIPMPGQAESLNAATAAAIVLFEALRQRSA